MGKIPKYAKICQNMPKYAKISQNMPIYINIYQYMPIYAKIGQNMPKMPKYTKMEFSINPNQKAKLLIVQFLY